MTSWALVFSGQGQQHPDMLAWLAQDRTLAALDAELGPAWRARLADPHEAGHNRRAQILLTATACAAWAQLQPGVEPPAIVAGYSVGELAAWAAAGVFDARTAVELAGRRAAAMDAAAAAASAATGLLGVSGAAHGGIADLCARHDLEVAIRIDAASAVLGGLRAGLQGAAAAAAARGWRSTPLNVALASHTRWMRPAATAFGQVLAEVDVQRPALALVSNAQGRIRDAAGARSALAGQLARTVAWDECMDAIAAQRVQAVLEIGPGAALARMWQERHPDVPARSADEFRSAAAVVAWLTRQLGR
jgi:[acyl-carrier-protein] S-malonyltransferase